MKRFALVSGVLVMAACGPADPVPGSPSSPPGPSGAAPGGPVSVIPVLLHDKVGTPMGRDVMSSTLDYARKQRGILGLSALDDFQLLSSHVGMDGLIHVRLQQT